MAHCPQHAPDTVKCLLWGAKRCEDKYFTLWLKRLRNREEACRWIEKVQWAKLY